jgi:hypothetical protein
MLQRREYDKVKLSRDKKYETPPWTGIIPFARKALKAVLPITGYRHTHVGRL